MGVPVPSRGAHRGPVALAARIAVCIAVLGAASAAGAESAGDPAYRDALIEAARARKLHERPAWRALLHYDDRPLRGTRSPASSSRFFAAPDGATDPGAELAATLAAFFEATPRPGADDPPQCAFVARFHWLDEELHFDDARLPRLDCANFRAWRARLPAGGVTLVFPESFIDNPASMFGHTLLRLDGPEGSSELLGKAIDFTADIGDDGVLGYLAKGPVGLYPGFFALGPYYEKLERYAEWENRDIWEYALDLEPAEIDFLLMHLWELRGVALPYYFFDDNCSWRLLRLLAVTRPESGVSDGFPGTVLPIDTVRAVARVGWVREVRYRPSPATELHAVAASLPVGLRALAQDVARGDVAPDGPEVGALEPDLQAAVIGLAYASLRFDFLAGRREQDDARALSRRILVARSRLGRRGEVAVARPATRPDRGHGTARVSLAGGWRDGDGYLELRFRPSLHDFLDPAGGHSRGNRVAVLDTRVRYLPARARLRLEQLVLLDVASLSPWDRFLRPVAWTFDTGLRTRLVADPSPGDDFDAAAVWRTQGGVGLAASPVGPLLLYGLGHALLDVGPGLRGDVSLGPGATVGLFGDALGERLRVHLFASVTRFAAGDTTTWYRGGLEQRLRLGSQTALRLEASANRIDGDQWLEAGLSLSFYF